MRPEFRPDPLAFFLTWTTYGSWLPGDDRGWTDGAGAMHAGMPAIADRCRERMKEPPVVLDGDQRGIVATSIRDHCLKRGWALHAVNCRSQHVHVVVSATDESPYDVVRQFKAWATRMLRAHATRGSTAERRARWWTEGGSHRKVFDEPGLQAVVTYVAECQDKTREEPRRVSHGSP